MNITSTYTDGKAQTTGKMMHLMVDKYHKDMAIYAYLSLPQIFDKIKSLPYRPDPIEEEVLMRPRFTMNNQGSGGDCDDKAIALASYAKCVGIPYRFIAVRKDSMPVLHHVYTELYVNGQWI